MYSKDYSEKKNSYVEVKVVYLSRRESPSIAKEHTHASLHPPHLHITKLIHSPHPSPTSSALPLIARFAKTKSEVTDTARELRPLPGNDGDENPASVPALRPARAPPRLLPPPPAEDGVCLFVLFHLLPLGPVDDVV